MAKPLSKAKVSLHSRQFSSVPIPHSPAPKYPQFEFNCESWVDFPPITKYPIQYDKDSPKTLLESAEQAFTAIQLNPSVPVPKKPKTRSIQTQTKNEDKKKELK